MGRAIERYIELIEQLAEDDAVDQGIRRPGDYASGWQLRIAKRLGIKQPYLSKVWNRKIRPGLDEVELAIRRLSISPAFFFASFPTPPHYKDFRGVSRLPNMSYPALRRFLEAAEQSLKPTEEERIWLERQEWEGEPSEATYMLFLQALRTVHVQPQTSVKTRARRRSKGA